MGARGRLGAVAVILGLLAVACAPAAPLQPSGTSPAATAEPLMKLKVGVAVTPAPALPESVLWLARDLGFYQKEGLDVEITEVDATPSVITAMRTGDVDVGDINSEDVIRLDASKDLEMKTINSASGRNFFMLVANSRIGSLAELAGKSFAIARVGSQDDALSSKVLAANGLPADEVNYVAIGTPGVRAQALLGGQVDATTVSLGTWVTIQHQPNVKVLVGVDDYYNSLPLVNKGNAVTTRVLAEKPEALRRFTAALIKTSRYLAENKAAWVDGLRTLRPDIAPSDLDYLWDQFGASWAVNGQLNVSAYQTSTDFLYETGTFGDLPKIGAADWTDTEFVDGVLKDLGVVPNVDDPGRPIA
ncbi:MAG: ABC transporter substrate-binding protein [Chloroflexi bacterium]|nr:ABC transporter substrate-binding protein [Chloroflexota bacterium]